MLIKSAGGDNNKAMCCRCRSHPAWGPSSPSAQWPFGRQQEGERQNVTCPPLPQRRGLWAPSFSSSPPSRFQEWERPRGSEQQVCLLCEGSRLSALGLLGPSQARARAAMVVLGWQLDSMILAVFSWVILWFGGLCPSSGLLHWGCGPSAWPRGDSLEKQRAALSGTEECIQGVSTADDANCSYS